jgi:hypothetical protein
MSNLVQTLQAKQIRAMTAMYAANRGSKREAVCKAIYESTVRMLESIVGPDAHIGEVDQDLYGAFSDCYKGEIGCRPRFHISRKDVVAWFEDLQSPQAVAARAEREAADAEWMAEMLYEDNKKAEEDAAWAIHNTPLKYEEYDVA